MIRARLYQHLQMLSLNIVDAASNKKIVTAQSDLDLWWALKGAGANFGIVTSGVFKSYPLPQANNIAWTGPVVFDQNQLEQVISAMNDIDLEPEMQLDNAPTVIALPFYLGNEEARRVGRCHAIAIPWHDDPALADEANEFGQKARATGPPWTGRPVRSRKVPTLL
ncbi:hypothetical protein DL764_006389 [Monosporascus ibericus]|uniref:Uncharacterized protein n=1 Tax=Monosporascus ibericus TaxID=155417 RepID=A0A4Q4T818_9PEZI|nr:hypothetical protein DL764_006389 [Monosporascus ibericus]